MESDTVVECGIIMKREFFGVFSTVKILVPVKFGGHFNLTENSKFEERIFLNAFSSK